MGAKISWHDRHKLEYLGMIPCTYLGEGGGQKFLGMIDTV